MRHLERIDWILLASLVPIWLLSSAATLYETTRPDSANLPFSIRGAPTGNAFPEVRNLRRDAPIARPIQIGDQLLRVGTRELRGASSLRATAVAYAEARGGRLALEIGRGESRWAIEIALASGRSWRIVPFMLAMGLTGLLLLVRAPDWHLARPFFAASLGMAIAYSTFWTGGDGWTIANALLRLVFIPVAITASLCTVWGWAAEAWPLSRPTRALAAVLGVTLGALNAMKGWFPGPFQASLAGGLYNGLLACFALALLVGVFGARRYATPLERRQQRFILYGFAVALVPQTIALSLAALGGPDALISFLFGLAHLALVAIPLGFLIAVVGYRYLDIDRLIGATASYALLGISLLVAVGLGVPRLADALNRSLGIDPGASQLLVAVAIGAVLLPAHRRLRPAIDRWILPERYALDRGFHELIEALGAAKGVEQLVSIAGEQLEALVRPRRAVCYALSGDGYTPIFARGRAIPPAYRSDTPLIAALRERRTPLVAGRWAERQAALSPFDRAALESLDVAVVLPIQRDAALVAFVCLGPKRSGDVYTSTDLSLLAAASSKMTEELRRIDDAQMIREARELEASLRRFVPGAVVDQLDETGDTAVGERQVCVLFVDIRSYLSFSEGREASEIFSTVNRHTEQVSRIVAKHGGAVVEFNGDGMMAAFGAAQDDAQMERNAVAAALEIADSMRAPISVGIGIATGPGFVGNIRAADRLIWSVIGNTTSLAARLQSLTRELDAVIAIDAATRERAGSAASGFSAHEGVRIRGRTSPLTVWTLPLAQG